MRSTMIIAAAVVAGIFLAAPMATADEVEEQLRLMDQRLAEMEDRLQATSEELRSAQETVEEQQSVLSSVGFVTDDDRGNRSGISNFLSTVDFSGWVATSYNHRLYDGSDDNMNTSYAFHPDANTFALDQVWFVIDKAPTEESRAGFHVDLNWGKMNNVYGGMDGVHAHSDQNDNLYAAYVSYLAPIGSGIQFDAGVLPTLLGAEVAQQNANFNITRGLVYGLQPVTHTGLIASGEIAPGLSLAFGVVNDVFTDTSSDVSNSKTYTGQLAYSADTMSAAVSFIIGQDQVGQAMTLSEPVDGCRRSSISECNTAIVDFLFTADPSDSVSMWLNLDWVSTNGNDADNTHTVGVATATRVAITDKVGLGGRVEFVAENIDDNEAYIGSLTATSDYALTDNLKARGELRWDHQFKGGARFPTGNENPNNPPNNPIAFNRDDVVVVVAELLYSF